MQPTNFRITSTRMKPITLASYDSMVAISIRSVSIISIGSVPVAAIRLGVIALVIVIVVRTQIDVVQNNAEDLGPDLMQPLTVLHPPLKTLKRYQ